MCQISSQSVSRNNFDIFEITNLHSLLSATNENFDIFESGNLPSLSTDSEWSITAATGEIPQAPY